MLCFVIYVIEAPKRLDFTDDSHKKRMIFTESHPSKNTGY